MKFYEIIEYLKTIDATEKIIASQLGDLEIGLIDVYLIDKLDFNSEVKFFDVATIPNDLNITINGVHYVNLLPLQVLQEMIEDYFEQTSLSNMAIAKKILEYRIKDA